MTFTSKTFLKFSLCLTIFISLFTISVQAADNVKTGKYANEAVDGEFSWSVTLNADNTIEFVTGDYEGIYENTGTWTADGEGNIAAIFPDTDSYLLFTGGGSDTLTIWDIPLYYEESSAPVTIPLLPAEQTVNPTAATVYVNGAAKSFEAYNIAGSNYFKLKA